MTKIRLTAVALASLLSATSPALAGTCADVAAAYTRALAADPGLPPILSGWDGGSGMPLMYMSDDGAISANIACNPDRDVNTLRFEIDFAAGSQAKALASFASAALAFSTAFDPQAKADDAAKSAAGVAAKSGKGAATLSLGATYSATIDARQDADGSGKFRFSIKPN